MMPRDFVTGPRHSTRMNPDRAATDLSSRQGGVLRRDQALAFGLTRGQIDQRVRDGRWHPVGRYGYRLIDMTDSLDVVRAAIAALRNATVSHHAAAELHDIPKVPRGIPSVTVHSRTTHFFPGVVVHRSLDIEQSHVTELAGIPTTTVSRTIVDLAALITRRHLASVVDEAVAAGQVSIEQLRVVLDQVSRRGKPGMCALREVLDLRGPGPERGSSLERLGARVLIEGGLPTPRYEFPVPWDAEQRFDVAYQSRSLAVEWDSRRWHVQVEAFSRDRERDRLAVLNGWRVLRFTWDDLNSRPEHVVDSVRRALAQDPVYTGV